jgi:hypothetical protein
MKSRKELPPNSLRPLLMAVRDQTPPAPEQDLRFRELRGFSRLSQSTYRRDVPIMSAISAISEQKLALLQAAMSRIIQTDRLKG